MGEDDAVESEEYVVCLVEDSKQESELPKQELFNVALKDLPQDAKKVMKQFMTEQPAMISWDLSEICPKTVSSRHVFKLAGKTLCAFSLIECRRSTMT